MCIFFNVGRANNVSYIIFVCSPPRVITEKAPVPGGVETSATTSFNFFHLKKKTKKKGNIYRLYIYKQQYPPNPEQPSPGRRFAHSQHPRVRLFNVHAHGLRGEAALRAALGTAARLGLGALVLHGLRAEELPLAPHQQLHEPVVGLRVRVRRLHRAEDVAQRRLCGLLRVACDAHGERYKLTISPLLEKRRTMFCRSLVTK